MQKITNEFVLEEKRILAIDFGLKRVGIAVTDPLNIFAYPLTTLTNDKNLIENLKKILIDYKVVKIIIGLPVKESGGESSIYEPIMKFREQLINITEAEIIFSDERYSSEIAKQRIIESVPSKKKRRDKSLIDKNAAAIILEDYLRAN